MGAILFPVCLGVALLGLIAGILLGRYGFPRVVRISSDVIDPQCHEDLTRLLRKNRLVNGDEYVHVRLTSANVFQAYTRSTDIQEGATARIALGLVEGRLQKRVDAVKRAVSAIE